MRYPKLKPLQLILCMLFVITICCSLVSLGYFIKDKPDKKVVTCEKQVGMEHMMKPVSLSGTNHQLDYTMFTRNCTTVTNPPISRNHQLMIDAATISGAMFMLVAGIAYITRKRDPLDPKDLPEQ